MMRRVFALGIVGVWLVAVGLLVNREYFGEGLETGGDALNVPPGAVFFSVNLGEEQVGFASSTVDTVPEGIFIQDVIEMRLRVGDALHRINRRTEVILDRTLSLRNFTTVIHGDEGRARIEATRNTDSLTVTVEAGETSHTSEIGFTPGAVLPSVLPMKLVFGEGLSTNAAAAVETLDPLTFKMDSAYVAVLADSTFLIPDSALLDSVTMTWSPIHYDTVHAWRTEYKVGAITADAWIDDLGRLVSYTTPEGFTVTRSVYEVVYENFRRRDTTEALASGLAPDGVSRLALHEAGIEPEPLTSLRVLIPGAGSMEAEAATQEVRGDTVAVRVATLPEDRPFRLGSRPPRMGRYLESDPVIPASDARVGARARQIIPRTRNPVTAARALLDWTSANVSRNALRDFPDAIRTAENGAGDPNGIVLSFVAMARTVGVPARAVGGLVYARGTFYHQSWAEVYLGDWIPVDPVSGQMPADASHVKLVDGLNRLLEFARFTGDLKPELLEARR